MKRFRKKKKKDNARLSKKHSINNSIIRVVIHSASPNHKSLTARGGNFAVFDLNTKIIIIVSIREEGSIRFWNVWTSRRPRMYPCPYFICGIKNKTIIIRSKFNRCPLVLSNKRRLRTLVFPLKSINFNGTPAENQK